MKTFLAVALCVVLGCGDSKPAAHPEPSSSTTPTPTSATQNATERQPVGKTLTVSDEIFRACHLDASSDLAAAPKFAFDENLITRDDAVVLDKIAVCLATGPLAGRRVKLTGRADSRGTEEYNLSLGARRAHGVGSYLEQHKVSGAHVDETSRGALDATGTSEATFAQDRRVDIALMPQ